MAYTIYLDGEPPKEHVVLSVDLCKRVLQFLSKKDFELYREFLREYTRSTRDSWGMPQHIRDKIPPFYDENELCFKKHVYALMKTRKMSREKTMECLKNLPKSEVISIKPIIITKVGFEIMKDRLW